MEEGIGQSPGEGGAPAEDSLAPTSQEGGVGEPPVLTLGLPRGKTPFRTCQCDGGEKCLAKDHTPTEENPHIQCTRTAGDRKTCQPCRKGRNRKRKKAGDDPSKEPSQGNPGGKRAPLAAAADTLARLSEGELLPALSGMMMIRSAAAGLPAPSSP